MPEEPDNLVHLLLRAVRAENSERFDQVEAVLQDVRLRVACHDLRLDAREESVEAVRERAVSAANASRARVKLRRRIAYLAADRKVEAER